MSIAIEEMEMTSQPVDDFRLTLSHLGGSRVGEVEEFSRESVLIGRGRHNDVALDSFLDPTVSTQHAEIRREDGVWMLYDMGSLNGSFVNGHRIRRVELRNGDEITLGRAGPRIVFQGTAESEARSHDSRDLDPLRDTLSESIRRPSGPATVSEAVQRLEKEPAKTAASIYWIAVIILLIGVIVALLLS